MSRGVSIQSSQNARRPLWVTGLLALVLFLGLAAFLAPLKPDVLALQFTFTPEAFGAVVHLWPPEHLARFRAHLPVDGLLLLAYGSFGYLLGTRTAVLPTAGAALLPLAAACDATENLLHAWFTEASRLGVAWHYAVAGSAAACKWALILAFGLLLAHGLARRGEA